MPRDAATALRNGTDLQLISLDPELRDPWPNPDGFHGWAVLGSTAIDSLPSRSILLDALDTGVAEVNAMTGMFACFDPRHGLRVTHNGRRHDFVICFECAAIRWYVDDTLTQTIAVSGSPQKAFDQALRDASIELPTQAD